MLEAAGCNDPDHVLYSLLKILAHGQPSSVVLSCFCFPCLRVPLAVAL